MRGKKAHFILQADTTPTATIPASVSRKLSPVEMKYEAMLYRYYFYSKIHKMSYDEIVAALMAEFFISDGHISNLIRQNIERIKDISKEGLTIKQLAGKYPMKNWPAPQPKKTSIFK